VVLAEVRSEVAGTAGEVAQTASLLYRGLATRWTLMFPAVNGSPPPWPATRRRHDRLPVCATSVRRFRSHPARQGVGKARHPHLPSRLRIPDP